MLESTPIVAFDQHAASVTAAILLPGHRRPALPQLAPDLPTIRRFVKKLQRLGAVRCCYEAGPCGFELCRALTADRVCCDVIAPALMPRRAGDRIKTDRRDATQLAILYRAGALTRMHIPTEQEEAVRDLLRCREDIRADLLRAHHRLWKFFLRHAAASPAPNGRGAARMTCGSAPTPGRCRRWPRRTRPIYGPSLKPAHVCRRSRPTYRPVSRWSRSPPRETLRCFRGVDDLTALTIATELSDPHRFPAARSVMAYVGLVPSEHSSGGHVPAAASRKPAMRICAASSSKRRGRIGIVRASAPGCAPANGASRPPSVPGPGRPNSVCIAATAGSPDAANRTSTWSPPLAVSSPGFSGPR